MTDRPRPLIMDRDDVTAAAWLAAVILDGPGEDDSLRDDVRELFADLSDCLLYNPPSDGRSVRLIPVGFRWPGFYVDMVEEFLLDLDDEVKADQPVRMQMACQAATLVDREGFSTDFRLDCLDALNQVLASLKRAADDDDGDDS